MIEYTELEAGRKCILARATCLEEEHIVGMVVVTEEISSAPWCVICSEGDKQLSRSCPWYEESNGTIVLDLESLEYYEEGEPDAF